MVLCPQSRRTHGSGCWSEGRPHLPPLPTTLQGPLCFQYCPLRALQLEVLNPKRDTLFTGTEHLPLNYKKPMTNLGTVCLYPGAIRWVKPWSLQGCLTHHGENRLLLQLGQEESEWTRVTHRRASWGFLAHLWRYLEKLSSWDLRRARWPGLRCPSDSRGPGSCWCQHGLQPCENLEWVTDERKQLQQESCSLSWSPFCSSLFRHAQHWEGMLCAVMEIHHPGPSSGNDLLPSGRDASPLASASRVGPRGERAASPEVTPFPGQPASADWPLRAVRAGASWPNVRCSYKRCLLQRPRWPGQGLHNLQCSVTSFSDESFPFYSPITSCWSSINILHPKLHICFQKPQLTTRPDLAVSWVVTNTTWTSWRKHGDLLEGCLGYLTEQSNNQGRKKGRDEPGHQDKNQILGRSQGAHDFASMVTSLFSLIADYTSPCGRKHSQWHHPHLCTKASVAKIIQTR